MSSTPAQEQAPASWPSWQAVLVRMTCMSPPHYAPTPATKRVGTVPSHPVLRENLWLLPRTVSLPVVQQLCMWAGLEWPRWAAFVAYLIYLVAFMAMAIYRFDALGLKHGVYDQHNRGRDKLTDESLTGVGDGMAWYLVWRAGWVVWSSYQPEAVPYKAFSWSYIVRWHLWFILLDYLFYAYHRTAHQCDWAWPIHADHHRTRHPTMSHSVLASHTQHLIEIMLLPYLTSLLVLLSFHEHYVLLLHLAYVETIGHTGIRLHFPSPNTWLVCVPLGAELTIEDHDLHHRYHRQGRNFGKQTRLWDKAFETMQDREESKGCRHRYW